MWLAAVATTAIITASYSLYNLISDQDDHEKEVVDENDSFDAKFTSVSKKYSDKRIAVTLSSLILNSSLPLNDILINSDKVVFILPPDIEPEDLSNEFNALLVNKVHNYKLMRCSNIQGYVHTLKNLKPDLLLVCPDDLGMSRHNVSKELNRFIKQIVSIDQTKEDLYAKIRPIFI